MAKDKALKYQDFPFVHPKAWKQRIQYDLKGADYNDTLVWESLEGIKVKPFYTDADVPDRARGVCPGGALKTWKIIHPVYLGQEKAAAKHVHWARERGAAGFFITLSEDLAVSEGWFGKVLGNTGDLHLEPSFNHIVDQRLLAMVRDLGDTKFYLYVDPIAHFAHTGTGTKTIAETCNGGRDP